MTKPKEAQLDLLLKISEGLSKRPYEMLQVSPTDAIHAPSCGLAIRDAVDELRWMRAERERLRAAIQSLAERLEVDPSGTDKIDDLEAEVERLQKRDAEWTEKAAAWLSSAEAAQRLDGYRELAARIDELTLQRDAAVTLLAEWCHAVDGGAGWDYWDNQYKEARWGKGILRSLIDAEIAKLESLEGEP